MVTRCTIPCACHAKRHLNLPPRVVRTPGAFNILTWKCASRHNGAHFFDISTSKSGPELVCFVHFDFHMCFLPQRRALFRHLNFQKWSEHGVLCTFWLRNVLLATTACTFSTSQLPQVLLRWAFFFTFFTCKCASRHNDVLFLSHLATWLRTRRFSEPTFRPSSHKSLEKHRVSQLYLFALDLLSSETFSFSIFFLLLFSSLTLPTCAFPSVHIVGSLTSKLPSIMKYKKCLKTTNQSCFLTSAHWGWTKSHVWKTRMGIVCRHGVHLMDIPTYRGSTGWSLHNPSHLQKNLAIVNGVPTLNPKGSMYATYGNIYHQYTPNVSIYTIHGFYGHEYEYCYFSTLHPHKNIGSGITRKFLKSKNGPFQGSKISNPHPVTSWCDHPGILGL